MEFRTDWATIRDRKDAKGLQLQYFLDDDNYQIWVEDGQVTLHTRISKDPTPTADQAEFENLYAPFANEPVHQIMWDEHNPEVQGFYECQGDKVLDIPATSGWHEFDYSWGFPIAIYNGTFEVNAEHVGDELAVHAMPNKIVGALTANCAVDDKTFNLDATSLGFFSQHLNFCGHLIEGANVSNLGRCVSVDTGAGTATFEDGAAFAHSAASPTYVAFTATFVLGWYMSREGTFRIADNMQGGSLLPANETLRLRYKNSDGVAKKLYWKMEYRM